MKFGRKKDTNYFELLNSMAECTSRAAEQLDEMLHNYTDVAAKAEAVHGTEHECDNYLHRLVRELNRAFITPIDREDLLQIGSMIDTITDAIEDVANSFEMLSIRKVEKPALDMSELIKAVCTALSKAVKEFEHFRSSKKLSEYVIEVNHLEEQADVLYRSTIKALYNNTHMTVLDVIKWKEIYDYMERIFDACEDVANLLEGTAIKNR